jgi:hypothetical protein
MKSEIKQEIKRNLKTILKYYGARETPYNWDCLHARHNNPKGNLTIDNNNNVCCCHCGLKGDSLNVISILENLDIKKDFPLIIEKGKSILNLNIQNVQVKDREKSNIKKQNNYNFTNYNLTKIITNYYTKINNFKIRRKTHVYFFKRNILKIYLFDKYKILIEDPRKVFPKELLPNVNNIFSYQNIIPVWEDGKVVNCLLRRDEYLNKGGVKILNLKGLSLKIFNIDYIKNSKFNDILFITEGIFDCLSFEDMGYKSISLNSISMIDKFVEILKLNLNQLIQNKVVLIIAFDMDEKGVEARKKLHNKIKEINLVTFFITIKEYKDVNEFYIKDGRSLYKIIKKIVEKLNERR